MTNSTLLDVDSSILEKKLRLPGKDEEEKVVNELLESFNKPEVPSILIKPSPGACIKVKTESGEKNFINVCTSNEIPPPEDISEQKLFQVVYMEDDNSYVIPMSIGQERLESDKGGVPTPTYDVVINADYFEKCQKTKSFWLFTSTVIIDGVSHKFNKSLNTKDHVVLKNRKVIGTLQEHRIEKRKPKKPTAPTPLIEEIVDSKNVKTENQDQVKDKNKNTLDHVILKSKDETEDALLGLFKIPSLEVKNVTLDIGEDRLIVEDTVSNSFVDIFLPYNIDQEHVSASMDSSLGILRVYLPLKKV